MGSDRDDTHDEAIVRLNAIAASIANAVDGMLSLHHDCNCPNCRTMVTLIAWNRLMDEYGVDDVEVCTREMVKHALRVRRQCRAVAAFRSKCEELGIDPTSASRA